jgi:Domain of unknown function (DUF4160)
VGSLSFDGIRFTVYSNDHLPRHVHAFFGDTEVVVDLLAEGSVGLASRVDAIRPANARRADVRKILNVAAERFGALVALWEGIHGNKA